MEGAVRQKQASEGLVTFEDMQASKCSHLNTAIFLLCSWSAVCYTHSLAWMGVDEEGKWGNIVECAELQGWGGEKINLFILP